MLHSVLPTPSLQNRALDPPKTKTIFLNSKSCILVICLVAFECLGFTLASVFLWNYKQLSFDFLFKWKRVKSLVTNPKYPEPFATTWGFAALRPDFLTLENLMSRSCAEISKTWIFLIISFFHWRSSESVTRRSIRSTVFIILLCYIGFYLIRLLIQKISKTELQK